MKPVRKLHERLLDLHDKYGDDELCGLALKALDMEMELTKTRWDRAREWAILVFVSAYILHIIWTEAAKWL